MVSNAVEFLEEACRRFPNKIGIDDAASKYTFAELKKAALILDSEIDESLLRQPILVLLPKSCKNIIAYMGILYSGNFYVPLDEKMPSDRLKVILTHFSDVHIVLNKTVLEQHSFLINQPNVTLYDIDEILSRGTVPSEGTSRYQNVLDGDPLYIKFTSGSTGVPKGVVVSHRSVIEYTEWVENFFQIDESQVIGNQTPFCFDMSVLDIYLSLKTGSTLKIIPEMYFAFPIKLVEYMNQEKISLIFWVPTAMANLVSSKLLERINPENMKKVLFCGEPMPVKCVQAWRAHFRNAIFSNLYGPTEATVSAMYFNVERNFSEDESLPIGFARSNSEVLILDTENHLVTNGEVGELCLRGNLLALGYWNDPEKTNAVFVQNPLVKSYQDKIYRTGDLAYKNKLGEIVLVGRKDHQIKHLGYRIDLGEIETAASALPYIDNTCCLYDLKNKAIVLFYESKSADFDENRMRIDLARKIPKYMIPGRYVRLEMFPLNTSTKIDRVRLKNEYLGAI